MTPLVEKGNAPISVERLCAEVTRALPEDGILVADTGYSGIWTGTMVDLNGAGQGYQRAAGSLGWAFPASLGATCAAGARQVVCFTGDGGFYYHLAELETARRCNIPVTVIVNNNSGFGQNLTGVRRVSGNRPGRGEELIRFGPTDFTAVARSFGVRGLRVEQPQEIAPVLQQALAADEPVLVDVVTGLEPRAPEAWAPPAQR
jgi:acetolactate synthase-1/2/3 large subunit